MAGKEMENVMNRDTAYDNVARGYETYAEPLTIQFAQKAIEMMGGIQQDEAVLEVGTGSGMLAQTLATKGARVVAVDFSSAMVSRVRQRLEPFPTSFVHQMDGQSLDLPTDTFAKCFSIFGVITFKDWHRGLAELVRVTKPGGSIVIANWAKPSPNGPATLVRLAFEKSWPDFTFPVSNAGILADLFELKSALSQAGCINVQGQIHDGVWEAKSVERTLGYCEMIINFIDIPEHTEASRRNELDKSLREIVASYTDAEGIVRVPIAANIVLGYVKN